MASFAMETGWIGPSGGVGESPLAWCRRSENPSDHSAFVARVAESAVRALRAQSTPSPDNGSRWPGSDAETLSAPSDEENSP